MLLAIIAKQSNLLSVSMIQYSCRGSCDSAEIPLKSSVPQPSHITYKFLGAIVSSTTSTLPADKGKI